MADLLPCPFCGGETYRDSSADCTGTPMVGCMDCSAHVVAGTQVGAETAWNRRALPAASQPEAEPVAWQQKHGDEWVTMADGWGPQDCKDWKEHQFRPLYTRPTPAPVVPAEGLDALVALLGAYRTARMAQGLTEDEVVRLPIVLAAAVAITALRAQQPAAPVSGVTIKPGIIERAVWSAMIWAASNNAGFDGVPEYTDRGNSFAEDEARRAAARILSALEGK